MSKEDNDRQAIELMSKATSEVLDVPDLKIDKVKWYLEQRYKVQRMVVVGKSKPLDKFDAALKNWDSRRETFVLMLLGYASGRGIGFDIEQMEAAKRSLWVLIEEPLVIPPKFFGYKKMINEVIGITKTINAISPSQEDRLIFNTYLYGVVYNAHKFCPEAVPKNLKSAGISEFQSGLNLIHTPGPGPIQ